MTGGFALGRHSLIDTAKLVAHVESTLASIKEGQPVPSRAELLLDFSPSLNANHVTTHLRTKRPDLYERLKVLEAAALAAATAEISAVMHRVGTDELKHLDEFAEIGARYGLGPATVRRLRTEARGSRYTRSRWDWSRIEKWLKAFVKSNPKDLYCLRSVGDLIGPEYLRPNTTAPRSRTMPGETFSSLLRASLPELHQSLLAIAARNRSRRNNQKKDSK